MVEWSSSGRGSRVERQRKHRETHLSFSLLHPLSLSLPPRLSRSPILLSLSLSRPMSGVEEEGCAALFWWGPTGEAEPLRLDGPERKITVGRRPDCTLTLSDLRVSGLHIAIYLGADGRILARDTSSNGTFLNGERMVKGDGLQLHQGDVLSIVVPLRVSPQQLSEKKRSGLIAAFVCGVAPAQSKKAEGPLTKTRAPGAVDPPSHAMVLSRVGGACPRVEAACASNKVKVAKAFGDRRELLKPNAGHMQSTSAAAQAPPHTDCNESAGREGRNKRRKKGQRINAPTSSSGAVPALKRERVEGGGSPRSGWHQRARDRTNLGSAPPRTCSTESVNAPPELAPSNEPRASGHGGAVQSLSLIHI